MIKTKEKVDSRKKSQLKAEMQKNTPHIWLDKRVTSNFKAELEQLIDLSGDRKLMDNYFDHQLICCF